MQDFIFNAHSGVRWLVVLATIIVFIWLIRGIVQNHPYDKLTHRIIASWSGLIGLQWILGIILFILMGNFDVEHRWFHAFLMTVALVVAHAYVPLKRIPNDIKRMQAVLASVLGVAILVFSGVMVLPQGWTG